MGFMDKLKDTVNKAAEGVQKVADTGQEKLEESKLKKKIGDLNQELGSLVFAQRTGNPADDTEAEITRLVGEIQAAEDHMTALKSDAPESDAPDGT